MQVDRGVIEGWGGWVCECVSVCVCVCVRLFLSASHLHTEMVLSEGTLDGHRYVSHTRQQTPSVQLMKFFTGPSISAPLHHFKTQTDTHTHSQSLATSTVLWRCFVLKIRIFFSKRHHFHVTHTHTRTNVYKLIHTTHKVSYFHLPLQQSVAVTILSAAYLTKQV